jgi:hypothetical protein
VVRGTTAVGVGVPEMGSVDGNLSRVGNLRTMEAGLRESDEWSTADHLR